MRIRLDGQEDLGKKRRRKSSRRLRRSRAFDSSVTLPKIQPRRQSGKRRGTKRKQWRRSRPAPAEPFSTTPRFRLRTVLARLPALLLLIGLAGVAIYVSVDAKFFVYEAQIEGSHHLKPEAIYRTAQIHEQNILWIRPEKVAERIFQLDGIKAVRVRCRLPAQVMIDVREREPVVMWRAKAQGHDFWLDKEGIVLPYPGDALSPDMVFVVDSSERHLQVGDRIEPEGIVSSVLQLAAALPGAQVFYYETNRGLYFSQEVGQGAWPVYVGTSEDLPRKIQIVQALTDYLVGHNIEPRYVDVRWPDHPVYGKPGSAQAGGGD
jgi:cell division septal protein FtsQ